MSNFWLATLTIAPYAAAVIGVLVWTAWAERGEQREQDCKRNRNARRLGDNRAA